MPDFVKNNVQPAEEKKFGSDAKGNKPVDIQGGPGDKWTGKLFSGPRKFLHRTGLLISVGLYLMVLPLHLALLLPVAIRSRFEWWLEGPADRGEGVSIPGWKLALGGLFWVSSWGTDLFISAGIGASALHLLVKLMS